MNANGTECSVELRSSDVVIATVRYKVNGDATEQSGMTLRSKRSLDALDANAEFTHDPVTIYYADGSSTLSSLFSPPSGRAAFRVRSDIRVGWCHDKPRN